MTFVSGRQILGARERQEDSFRIIRQDESDPGTDLLILLADGMGGHVGGEVASRLVVDVFEKHCITLSRNPKPADRLVEALEAANAALRERIRREPELAGMGSTLVAAMKLGGKLYWLSVGDSVLYLLRDGQLRRLNADHSVYGELVEHVREGRLTQQEAETHPRRNALRSAIIGDRIALVDCNAIALQRRDMILAASDGLETIDDKRIVELMSQPDRADTKAMSADLLSAVEAMARPRQDNATVVVYRYDPSAKTAMSTESLFRSHAARKVPTVGSLGIAGGVALISLLLGILIYAIGWGGRDVAPTQVAEDAAITGPETPQVLPRDVPRGPSTINRAQPESEEPLEGTVTQEPAPETVPLERGGLISPPETEGDLPQDRAVEGPAAAVPESALPDMISPETAGPEIAVPEVTPEGETTEPSIFGEDGVGAADGLVTQEEGAGLSDAGRDPLALKRARPRPVPDATGE
jgi:serine/threonine protein phosphatase PrpC